MPIGTKVPLIQGKVSRIGTFWGDGIAHIVSVVTDQVTDAVLIEITVTYINAQVCLKKA